VTLACVSGGAVNADIRGVVTADIRVCMVNSDQGYWGGGGAVVIEEALGVS
jgi:hypothetical protein